MPDTKEIVRTHQGAEVPVAGTYQIDPAHSTVAFVARHLVVSKVRGQFQTFSGSLSVAEDPTQSSVSVTIDVASINTNEEQRDTHLRSADFFEADTYPTITFQSTAVRLEGKEKWGVDGELTIKGVTKPVTLDVEFNGGNADPWGGSRIGFSATTEVDREEFGLTWNMAIEAGGVVVGRTVKIELEVEAVLQA